MRPTEVIFGFAVLALGISAFACQPGGEATEAKKREEDRLFQKKLECGRMLARIEGSTLGPEPAKNGPTPAEGPVVFYSPTLNTCVYIGSYFLGTKTETAYVNVEDLLTGQVLEQRNFDLNVPEQAKGFGAYEDEVVRRYGGKQLTSEQAEQEAERIYKSIEGSKK
ncbi:MAG: hypothetical protein ACLQOO_30175 [Terriglobia bacterium]